MGIVFNNANCCSVAHPNAAQSGSCEGKVQLEEAGRTESLLFLRKLDGCNVGSVALCLKRRRRVGDVGASATSKRPVRARAWYDPSLGALLGL